MKYRGVIFDRGKETRQEEKLEELQAKVGG